VSGGGGESKVRFDEGAEIRGDKVLVSCRQQPGKWGKVRRSENHHAFEAVLKQDARARILKRYTNVAPPKSGR
jgi:hypothetical protein